MVSFWRLSGRVHRRAPPINGRLANINNEPLAIRDPTMYPIVEGGSIAPNRQLLGVAWRHDRHLVLPLTRCREQIEA